MFTESDLKELVTFRSDEVPVLSVYLNVDPTQQRSEQYRLTLRSLLRRVSEEAEPADVQAVERYFDFEFSWQGRGVALFSCQAASFWRAFSLAVPVQNHAYVARNAYIKPLTDVLDAYGRYGVALVDSEGSRMFLFNLGELVEKMGTMGEQVRRLKHGSASGVAGMLGGRSSRSGSRVDGVIQRNLKEIAAAVDAFCTGSACTRLILAGSESNLSQFRDVLPKALQDKIIGSFNIDLGAPVSEVQAQSMEIIEQVAAQREAALVEEMIAGWRRRAGATAGLSDTLAALQEHRPRVLLVAAGYEAPGYRCQQCRYLMLAEKDECPLCGGQVEPVEDLVDTMVRRALEQGMEVEIVRESTALEAAGSIGALLRY